MRLEQHNIPSITPPLTLLFERSEAAERRKSLQRSEGGYADLHSRVHSQSEPNVWDVHSSPCQAEEECEKFSCRCSCSKSPSLTLGCFALFWHNIHSKNKSWWFTLQHENKPSTKHLLWIPSWLPSHSRALDVSPGGQGKGDKLPSRIPGVLLDHDSSMHTGCPRQRLGLALPLSPIFSPLLWPAETPPHWEGTKRRDSRTGQSNGAFLAEELESKTQKITGLLSLCNKVFYMYFDIIPLSFLKWEIPLTA